MRWAVVMVVLLGSTFAVNLELERHHRHHHRHRVHHKIASQDDEFRQPVGVGAACPSGVCQDKNTTPCNGGRYKPGLCPGLTNVQCCQVANGVGTTCTSGTCQDITVDSCTGGSYVPHLCPGPNTVQCCQRSGGGGGGGGGVTPPSLTSTCAAFVSGASCGFAKQLKGRGTPAEAATRATPCSPQTGNTFTCATLCCELIPGVPDNWISIPGDETSLMSRSSTGTVNPFVYDDRMSVYKILVEKTRAPFFADTLGISEGNILWGLPIQLFWQMRSKRLNAFRSKMISEMQQVWPSGGSSLCPGDHYRIQWTLPSPAAPQDKVCQTSTRDLSGTTVSWGTEFCGFPEPGSATTIKAQTQCQVVVYRDDDDQLTAAFTNGRQSASDSDSDFTLTYKVSTVFAPDDGSTISPWRWWGGMNYYLVIIPYMGAAKAGVVADLTFSAPSENAGKYCITRATCESLMPFKRFSPVEAWAVYFRAWASLKSRTDGGYVATADDLDELRRLDWLAHSASIKTSLALFEPESHLMVELERQVGVGWATFVEFIVETRLNVDFPHTNAQQNFLAQRILTDCDRVQSSCSPRLSQKQQVAVATFTTLYHLAQCPDCFNAVFNGWKLAMGSPAGRQHGRDIIEQTFQDFSTLFTNLGPIIMDYLRTNNPFALSEMLRLCTLCGPEVMVGVFGQT